ncbi:MAG: hypothetical protein STHCBS139747_003517 [Sporothrix thermara]
MLLMAVLVLAQAASASASTIWFVAPADAAKTTASSPGEAVLFLPSNAEVDPLLHNLTIALPISIDRRALASITEVRIAYELTKQDAMIEKEKKQRQEKQQQEKKQQEKKQQEKKQQQNQAAPQQLDKETLEAIDKFLHDQGIMATLSHANLNVVPAGIYVMACEPSPNEEQKLVCMYLKEEEPRPSSTSSTCSPSFDYVAPATSTSSAFWAPRVFSVSSESEAIYQLPTAIVELDSDRVLLVNVDLVLSGQPGMAPVQLPSYHVAGVPTADKMGSYGPLLKPSNIRHQFFNEEGEAASFMFLLDGLTLEQIEGGAKTVLVDQWYLTQDRDRATDQPGKEKENGALAANGQYKGSQELMYGYTAAMLAMWVLGRRVIREDRAAE